MRANSLDGKDKTIEKSRKKKKKRKACLKIRAAHGSEGKGMQLIVVLLPIGADRERQKNCGFSYLVNTAQTPARNRALYVQ